MGCFNILRETWVMALVGLSIAVEMAKLECLPDACGP